MLYFNNKDLKINNIIVMLAGRVCVGRLGDEVCLKILHYNPRSC